MFLRYLKQSLAPLSKRENAHTHCGKRVLIPPLFFDFETCKKKVANTLMIPSQQSKQTPESLGIKSVWTKSVRFPWSKGFMLTLFEIIAASLPRNYIFKESTNIKFGDGFSWLQPLHEKRCKEKGFCMNYRGCSEIFAVIIIISPKNLLIITSDPTGYPQNFRPLTICSKFASH